MFFFLISIQKKEKEKKMEVDLKFVLTLTSTFIVSVLLFFRFFQTSSKKQKVESFESHVLPHSEIQCLKKNIFWFVTGTLPPRGPPFGRNMGIYKIPGTSDLLLFSPIALSPKSMQELESLGKIKYLIAPNCFHRLDIGVYKLKYPEALVMCPSVSVSSISQVVPVDKTCEEILSKIIPNGFCFSLPGTMELLYALPLAESTETKEKKDEEFAFVVADMLFNLPSGKYGFFVEKILGSAGFFGVTRIGRFFLWRAGKRKEFANELRKCATILNWKILFVAHGDIITENCSNRLIEASQRLK